MEQKRRALDKICLTLAIDKILSKQYSSATDPVVFGVNLGRIFKIMDTILSSLEMELKVYVFTYHCSGM